MAVYVYFVLFVAASNYHRRQDPVCRRTPRMRCKISRKSCPGFWSTWTWRLRTRWATTQARSGGWNQTWREVWVWSLPNRIVSVLKIQAKMRNISKLEYFKIKKHYITQTNQISNISKIRKIKHRMGNVFKNLGLNGQAETGINRVFFYLKLESATRLELTLLSTK